MRPMQPGSIPLSLCCDLFLFNWVWLPSVICAPCPLVFTMAELYIIEERVHNTIKSYNEKALYIQERVYVQCMKCGRVRDRHGL